MYLQMIIAGWRVAMAILSADLPTHIHTPITTGLINTDWLPTSHMIYDVVVNLCRLDAQHNSPSDADSFCCITTHPGGEKTYFLHLGKHNYLECTKCGSEPRIQLRRWGETATGLHRTRKGVSLNIEGWQKLLSSAEDVDYDIGLLDLEGQDISQMYPLTNKIFASVKTPYLLVGIRYWFNDRAAHDLQPSARGITLHISEWRALLQADRILNTLVPDKQWILQPSPSW